MQVSYYYKSLFSNYYRASWGSVANDRNFEQWQNVQRYKFQSSFLCRLFSARNRPQLFIPSLVFEMRFHKLSIVKFQSQVLFVVLIPNEEKIAGQ